ncbi:cyclopropane-fatty-acyl-phospholipid synthase family protein [Deinococcus sonorensis]|uniref:Cyclopropane-fatty-acyl-phospholipid synthase family protein n=2 Tax=Deinococcus sonorensis TaxID=309891 RepID=A0AAU7U6G6_9DEIO
MSGLQLSGSSLAQPRALTVSRRILRVLFGPPATRPFGVRWWDGQQEGPRGAPATLVLNRPGALRRMLLPPSDLSLAEGYLYGDFDVDGDLVALLRQLVPLGTTLLRPATWLLLLPLLLSLPGDDAPPRPRRSSPHEGEVHSTTRDAQAIRYHYDVGNDFYALWLDQRMVYSCAYFPSGHETLDEAQVAKLDRICRKLRLKPGERLLDIGCGWGALAIHAAQHYGVHVTGITLSPAQLDVARQRAHSAGVADRVTFELMDYRAVPPGRQYDKIASVGMVEHVGRARLQEYFTRVYRLLKPGGLFLNHGIVTATTPRFVRWGFGLLEWYLNRFSFIQEYVFPDGDLRRISETLQRAEQAGFETRDVENLREHYALTLREWIRRLEQHHASVVQLADEVTYRIWRLYMSGSAQSFEAGRIGVVQSLLARPDADGHAGVPLSRADIEQPPPR